MLQFNSLAELDEFVDRFEKAQIPQPEFSHRAHLAIAANYLALMPFDVAVGQVRQGLRNLLEAYKIDGYNETITLFWMNRALEYVRKHGTGSNRLDVVNDFVAEGADSSAIRHYYSPGSLSSPEARIRAVSPDLAESVSEPAKEG